jgi:hypothetical protein
MREDLILQSRIIDEVRRMVGAKELISSLAELLNLSQDSIYRRVRGETLLNIYELQQILLHFDLSLDDYLDASARRVSFSFQAINEQAFNFKDYLAYVERMMRRVAQSQNAHMMYFAKDIPIFHLFNAPKLAAFKLFYWRKTVLDFSAYRNKKFSFDQRDEEVNDISRRIRAHYYKVPATEVYSPETIDATLNEVMFYFTSGFFQDPHDALLVLDSLEELLAHLALQCEKELRFKPAKERGPDTQPVVYPDVTYTVIFNEILFTDATVLVRLDEEKWSYLSNNGLHVLGTRDVNYYDQCHAAYELIARRATRISGTSEKERNAVFNRYHTRIQLLRKRILHELEQNGTP